MELQRYMGRQTSHPRLEGAADAGRSGMLCELYSSLYMAVLLFCIMVVLGCVTESKAGKWLADGWFGCMWALLGDQDHKRDAYKMANVISNKPCTQESLRCDKCLSWNAVWGYSQRCSLGEINMTLPLVIIAQPVPSYAPGLILDCVQSLWRRHGKN